MSLSQLMSTNAARLKLICEVMESHRQRERKTKREKKKKKTKKKKKKKKRVVVKSD